MYYLEYSIDHEKKVSVTGIRAIKYIYKNGAVPRAFYGKEG